MIADRKTLPVLGSVRRFWVILILLVLSCFPVRAVLVAWDANPPSEGVEGYKIYLSIGGVTNVPIDVGNVTIAALPNLVPGTPYTISLTAYNSVGEGEAASIDYTVPFGTAPSISGLGQPASQALFVGELMSLNVSASGSEPLRYDWFRNGAAVPGATTANLLIANAQIVNGGNYLVRISNPIGAITSQVATVTVNAVPGPGGPIDVIPTITQNPSGTNVQTGQFISLSVDATGTDPFIYRWYKNGTLLGSEINPFLAIFSAILGDTGEYLVVVSNIVGAATSTVAQVTVTLPPPGGVVAPIIVNNPVPRSVHSGAGVTFSVTTSIAAPYSYQWFLNDQPINGATQETLTLTGLTQANAGNYTVRVSNSAGSDVSEPALLLIHSVPSITSQPVDVTVPQGGIAILSAGGAGSGLINYQWYKDGIPLPGATGSTFTIESAQPSHEGSYAARISDLSGTSISAPALLHVVVPPVIVGGPASLRINEGSIALFTVLPSPYTAAFQFQWMQDGKSIAGATNSYLYFLSASYANSGEYSVRVSNIAGSVVSTPALLEIAGAPRIMSQSQGNVAHEGTPFNFTVNAAGAGPLEYKWYFNGFEISGANSSTYSIPSPGKSDEGTYWATVRNGFGVVGSTPIQLQVILRPSITQQPANVRTAAGTSATFQVAAQGPGSLQYQWYKGDVLLEGQQSATLQLSSVQPSVGGTYSVSVANVAGQTVSQGATLTVLTAPVITAQPTNSTITEGQTLILEVSATGSSPLAYQWLKGIQPISGATSNVLSIANITPDAAGNYSVAVTNEAGSVTSETAVVIVNSGPHIVEQPQSATVNEGSRSSFTLRVQTSGTGALEYQWLKDGVPILGATSADLTFSTVLRTDAGTYQLRVSNPIDTVLSAPAVLTVMIGPVIVTQPASQTTNQGSSLSLAVEASGSAPFEYQWLRNGVAIANANGSQYTVASAAASNAGIYSVRVANIVGSVVSQPAQVTVLSPPAIVSQSSNQDVLKGENIVLSVVAGGTGPFSYQWFKDGAPLVGAITPNLVIYGADPFDAGSYHMEVTSPLGTKKSPAITVVVRFSTQAPLSTSMAGFQGRLVLAGASSGTHTLQASDALVNGSWSDIGTVTVNSNGTFEFQVRSHSATAAHFFRLKR